jgi:F-type H+-transporting ATPase subunit delta
MNPPQDQDLDLETADVGAQRVAHVYAEALLNSAGQQGDAAVEELESLIGDVFAADPDFETFLSSGAVGRDQKAQVIQSVFGSRGTPNFVNFLLVLNAHERLNLLRPILEAAREIRDQRARRIRVEVRSAVPLPDDQRERLRQQLRESFHQEPLLETRVDADLLGGLVLRVGDWLYDASVRTKLETLRNQLIAESSHEIQSRRDRFSSDAGN